MKQVFICTILTLYLASTFMVSAWAMPCMKDTSPVMMHHVSASSGSDIMPCHETADVPQDTSGHCDGICLCFDMSLTKTPIITEAVTIPDVFGTPELHVSRDDILISYITSPPYKPPIYTS